MNPVTDTGTRFLITTVEQAGVFLEKAVLSLPESLRELCRPVLEHPQFFITPGGHSRHHTYNGGLAVHTAQMLASALEFVTYLADADIEAMIVAGVWHDFGKIYDYAFHQPPPSGVGGIELVGSWQKTPHYARIGHLTRSYMEFMSVANRLAIDSDRADFIGHLILAHHGRLEWGSPVVPSNAEAWALHAGDMLSAQFGGEKSK